MRICRSGYSCFGMQARIYLHASPDAFIYVLKPSDSYKSMQTHLKPVCYLECSYTLQAQLLICPYVYLGTPLHAHAILGAL